MYKQGVYTPINAYKYKGSLPIIYRSGLELKFDRWCDRNPNIVQWGSETFVIPYVLPIDNKVHRYFVDNYVKLNVNGNIKKYLVEIKPFKKLKKPNVNYNWKSSTLLYEQTEWIRNQAKWEAAKNWCDKNDYEFIILTEKDLN